jgi:hypothetical protein
MTQPLAANLLPLSVCAIAMSIAPSARGALQEDPRFRSGIELIKVTATVTDDNGRFVGDLRQEASPTMKTGSLNTFRNSHAIAYL